jgi:hypothetical protein
VGTNDIFTKGSETIKDEFNCLFNLCKQSGKMFFISGPMPTLGRGNWRFSRLLSLNTWLQSAVDANDFKFIDNFNLFWNRAAFF